MWKEPVPLGLPSGLSVKGGPEICFEAELPTMELSLHG